MKSRFRIRVIDLMLLVAVLGYAGYKGLTRPPKTTLATSGFAAQVDLAPLERTAVQGDGRLRSFESHAKKYMGYISGPRAINDQANGFTYLDLIFRPERYASADIIYVKNKPALAQILAALEGHPELDASRRDAILKSKLISRTLLSDPSASALLQRMARDLIRTSKVVNAIEGAFSVADPRVLLQNLRIIAPPGGGVDTPWIPVSRLVGAGGAPADDVHTGVRSIAPIPGLDKAVQDELAEAWQLLGDAWRGEDAAGANVQIARIARIVPTIAPSLYPSSGRLAMESWYFRNKSMTWVWLIYLASVIPLLMSVIYKWNWARKTGMVMFGVAFGFHTATLIIRWYISGRWPNSNMFEALTTSAWFGGVVATVLEWVTRRTAFRNLFALGSAVASMAALMAAYFLPTQLDSSISNKMAALNDVWLYIHTNVIISSYALIGLACVTALLYLRHRWCVAWDRLSTTSEKGVMVVLPIAVAVFNLAAYRLMMHHVSPIAHGLSHTTAAGIPLYWAWAGALVGSGMFLYLTLASARQRIAAGGTLERAAEGGAAALILGSGGTDPFVKREGPSGAQVLDGATMVLIELSFITLWTGLVMGAIWADHSWGRPWGWDPKEVFALNTFLIIIALIHVRMKVRDKGLWTAILAVFGFQVMMFNWIVINFIVTGLHSYA